MKKVVIAAIALSLFSTSAFAAGGGKKKSKKAKAQTVCTKTCVPTKDCKKSTTCPIMPGCVCL